METRIEETTFPVTVEGIPWLELKPIKIEPQPASMKQARTTCAETMLRETMAHYVSSLCRHATVNSGRKQRTWLSGGTWVCRGALSNNRQSYLFKLPRSSFLPSVLWPGWWRCREGRIQC